MTGRDLSGTGDATPKEPRPVALLVYTDLMFGVQLQSMARYAGYVPVAVQLGKPVPQGDIMVVDLSVRGDWEVVVREAHGLGIPVVAFGPHMDAEGRKRAKAAGAGRVLANSNLQRDLPGLLLAHRGTGTDISAGHAAEE